MRKITVVALAIAAALAAAVPAQAKISCEGLHPAAEIEVVGLPAEPVAGVEYHVSLMVPRGSPANPRPIVMLAHCVDAHEPGFTVELPGAGAVEFPLRFSEAGSWRATLMDRGGRFHSLGTFEVASAGASAAGLAQSATDGGAGAALPIAAIALAAAAGALLLARRRSS